jgi:hypothetical protein
METKPIKIIFDYADHDSRETIKRLYQAEEALSVAEDVYNELRGWLKHGDVEYLKEEDFDRLEAIKGKLCAVVFKE